MGLKQVPDDIILLILRRATQEASYGLCGWKRKLPILWVCRKWRVMAHRLVFDNVYIESLESGKARLKTNAGLCSATKVDTKRGPKKLTLLVENGDGNIELAMVWAMTVLETHRQTTEQIENLRLEFSESSSNNNSNSNNPNISSSTSSSAHRAFRQSALHTVAGIMSLAGQLVKLLPHIKEFKFSVGKVDKGATMFGYVVARHYAKQLARLDTNSVLCLPGAGFEGQHLTLRTNIVGARLPRNSNSSNDNADTPPPRIEPRTLERLHLSRVDYRFDWRVFLSGGNSSSVGGGVINFPKLKHVVVETSTAPARPPSNALPGYLTNMTINAPLLQSWHTEVTPFSCLLLWAASGATRPQQQQQQMQKPHPRRCLDILWLDCMDGTELTLRNVDIYKLAQSVIQKYALRRMGATIGGVELGNDVFGTRLANHLAAIIRGATLTGADAARMRWTHIDSLEIKARISWNTLKGLLARTPYLTDLKAHCVTDVPQAVASDIEWQTVRGTRIRRAWIRMSE